MGSQKYSKEEELQIVEEYRSGISVNTLCEKYGYKGKKSILDKVKKYYPDNYEDIIEEAKNNRTSWSWDISRIKNKFDAYLIGLLLTDGYITSDNTGFGIDLIDEDCISFIANQLKASYKKYEYSSDDKTLDKYDRQPRFRVVLRKKEIVQQLERFGIVKNKTYNLQPPTLYEEEYQYLPYLIRGIIDGDGCIFENSNNKKPNLYILTASKSFAEWLKFILTTRLFLQGVSINLKKSDNEKYADLYKVEIFRENDIKKIQCLVYDEPYGMERKFKKIDAQRL